MAFYSRPIALADVNPRLERLRAYLSKHGKVVNEPDDDCSAGVYFIQGKPAQELAAIFPREYDLLVRAGLISRVPFYSTPSLAFLIYFIKKRSDPKPTISPSHCRIPLLSHLTQLTPQDFFNFFVILAASPLAGDAKNSISLNLSAAKLTTLNGTPLEEFFTIIKTNHRINSSIAAPVWTPRSVISMIAELEPTSINHYHSLQYLAALGSDQSSHLPIDAAIGLEIEDIAEIDDDYCQAQAAGPRESVV